MPEEDDGEPMLFGMDAEHAEKMKEKLHSNRDVEQQALAWISSIIGEALTGDDVYTCLKSGVVLCKLANAIKPNVVRAINLKPLAVCERENIKSYIRAVEFIGVSRDELFDVSDLHEKKSLNAVVTNIYALGRLCQTIPTFTGPILGVKYNVTIEEKKRREIVKQESRLREQVQYEEYQNERKHRREQLEDEKETRRLKREDTIKEKIKDRRTKKGRRISANLRLSANLSVSPVRYGMDMEHEKKMEERLMAADASYEDAALDWIEEITGVVLCQLANCIQPGIVPKISNRKLAAVHRENIQMYLNACAKFGIPTYEMFTVADLYEGKGMSAVAVNIYALARYVQSLPNTKIGATLTSKNGQAIMISAKPKDGSSKSLSGSGSARSLRRSLLLHANPNPNPSLSNFSKISPLRNSKTYRPQDFNDSLTAPLLDPPSNPEPKEKEEGCCCTIM